MVLVAVGLIFLGGGAISSRSRSSSSSSSSGDGEDIIKSLFDGDGVEATAPAVTTAAGAPSQATLPVPSSSKLPLTPTAAAAAAAAAKPAPAPSLQQILDDAAALNADKARQKVDFWGNEMPAAEGEGKIKSGEEELEDMEEEGQDVEVDEERGVCYVENAVEFRKAIYQETCEMIQLASVSNDIGEPTQDKVGRGGRKGGRAIRQREGSTSCPSSHFHS